MIDMVPTFTTSNERICLLMTNGQMGSLRIEDAERLQVPLCLLPCCAVLCCAVLCCAVLCCAVLCCAVLCCAVLCCAVQCTWYHLTLLLTYRCGGMSLSVLNLMSYMSTDLCMLHKHVLNVVTPEQAAARQRSYMLVCNMGVAKQAAVWVQGLPEGHTEACYPVLRPGVDSHRAPPLKDSDSDKREVCR